MAESEDIEMRVNDLAQSPIGPTPTPGMRGVGGSRPGGSAENASGSGDEVSLSERARLLHKAKAALSAQQEEVRAAVLEAVRRQLDEGSYEIPLDELAVRLLRLLK